MNIFIDLGAHNGDTLEMAYKKYSYFDMFVGFEPVPCLADQARKRFSSKKIVINDSAAWIKNEENVKLYLSRKKYKKHLMSNGSTLFGSKLTGCIDPKVYIRAKVIDFSEFLENNFKCNDYIILKCNIEGSEYDVLEHLIKTGNISFINKLYCAWHFHKIKGIDKERHDKLVEKLNELGFNLTGRNKRDDFIYMLKREAKIKKMIKEGIDDKK
jgi:FkbM family methyltransferase